MFHREQRIGILSLLLLIVASLCVYHYTDRAVTSEFDISSEEIVALQEQIDSLRIAEIEARKPKQYPFNPNFITDYKAYTLGLPTEAFDKLKAFRAKDQWINSAKQFQQVTGVSDSLQLQIAPWFKFPEWVTNPKSKKKPKYFSETKKKSFAEKIDLNKASIAQLRKIYGIGEALSNRITSYRDKIGGFSNDVQLYSVWGLNETVIGRVLEQFTVKNPKQIIQMNINTSSASDIATIPGISFDLAKEIWEFRILREHIYSFSELQKIQSLSSGKLSLIQLYLFVE